jgi:hypothetical protein
VRGYLGGSCGNAGIDGCPGSPDFCWQREGDPLAAWDSFASSFEGNALRRRHRICYEIRDADQAHVSSLHTVFEVMQDSLAAALVTQRGLSAACVWTTMGHKSKREAIQPRVDFVARQRSRPVVLKFPFP